MPVVIRARGDDVAVHSPVVVLAEGEAVSGMVVSARREGNEMGRVDEGDVVAGVESDTQAAGGALMVVDVEDETAECGGAAVFDGLVGDEREF